jgi:cbb3-type cytochrome oxidase subunit 3
MYQWLYQDNPYVVYPIFALVLFIALFAGTLWWAFSPGHKRRFDDAGRLPLEGGNER